MARQSKKHFRPVELILHFQVDDSAKLNETKSSEELISEWDLNPIDIHYTQEEFKTLSSSMRVFASSMKPRICVFNPGMKQVRLNTLIGKSAYYKIMIKGKIIMVQKCLQ
jgi:hypothetical protein